MGVVAGRRKVLVRQVFVRDRPVRAVRADPPSTASSNRVRKPSGITQIRLKLPHQSHQLPTSLRNKVRGRTSKLAAHVADGVADGAVQGKTVTRPRKERPRPIRRQAMIPATQRSRRIKCSKRMVIVILDLQQLIIDRPVPKTPGSAPSQMQRLLPRGQTLLPGHKTLIQATPSRRLHALIRNPHLHRTRCRLPIALTVSQLLSNR